MAQAAYIADTIVGMKRAIARYDDSSDSDEPYLQPTNRGNKLKRKAHCLGDRLAGGPNGLKIYKKGIEHAGYQRDILRRNPKRYDEDGDELDDDDSDEEADARAAEDNPYAEISLEDLLVPLTSAASLPNHPSLSVPYVSSTLTDMAQQACDMVRRERRTLSNAKQLLTRLRGDETWIPCGTLYTKDDEEIFNTAKLYDMMASSKASLSTNRPPVRNMVNGGLNGDLVLDHRTRYRLGRNLEAPNGAPIGSRSDQGPASGAVTNETTTNSSISWESSSRRMRREPTKHTKDHFHNIEVMETAKDHSTEQVPPSEDANEPEKSLKEEGTNNIGPGLSATDQEQLESVGDEEISSINGKPENEVTQPIPPREDNGLEQGPGSTGSAESSRPTHDIATELEDGDADPDNNSKSHRAPRRMRTRAQAQAPPEPLAAPQSATPEPSISEIHPLFLIPEAAIPDKDLGLPAHEAEETRRMLMVYVQKQEEVCRGAEGLYDGLLKADAQRKTVYKWCKAEGHVGEMSDGEDWYDKEEWALEEDLRKGHNEDDEDNVIQGKKTRGRRA